MPWASGNSSGSSRRSKSSGRRSSKKTTTPKTLTSSKDKVEQIKEIIEDSNVIKPENRGVLSDPLDFNERTMLNGRYSELAKKYGL